VLADDAIDFMITGKAAKLMMAKPTFRTMEPPAFFDYGCHLSLPDCHPPHMGYRGGSVQPAAFGSWPLNAPCVLSAYEEIARPATPSTSKLAWQRLTAPHSHTIRHRQENFVGRVRATTGGRRVDVAYDSVGKDPSRARSRAWRCGATW